MAQLAIRGHATRGKEVIEILEMLGGSNPNKYCAECDSLYFYINKGTNKIYYDWVRDCYEDGNTLVFTLEEFLDKFPYKVGDKVKVCGDNLGVIISMRWESDYVIYKVKFNKNGYETSKTSENLQPYKEETMDRKYNVEEYLKVWEETEKGLEVVVNDRFELKEDNGKFYIIKKQPEYPKTYEECCEILNWNHRDYDRVGYNSELLCKLQVLLLCRDAYWKIAGEQMGLGKPWKPDWNIDGKSKYVILCRNNNITKDTLICRNCIFAFPTEEMQDAFLENFKKLIEDCKELL